MIEEHEMTEQERTSLSMTTRKCLATTLVSELTTHQISSVMNPPFKGRDEHDEHHDISLKIRRIKMLRAMVPLRLKEAKQLVEFMEKIEEVHIL